ncbi:MAG: Gfo/Idh/MocA family oxidoreductase [Clostridia bacterium]
MKQKVRFGVLGGGGIADRRTLPAMMLCEDAELVSVMEIDPVIAEKLRAKYSAKRAFVTEEELLSDPEIDAVYIASPVSLHARQAMLAADNKKHILIEKPLALTALEGQRVVDYCAQKGVLIAAGFMMRFGSYTMAIKEAFAAGKIGTLVSAYAQFTCWYPDMPGNWRQKKSGGGGGALMDMGVHCIDLIQYITRNRVREVAAFNDTMTFHYEVEDSSCVLLRLENGAMCVVQTNFNIPDEAAKWRLEFFGTRGRMLGDNILGQVDGGSVDACFLASVSDYDAQQDGKTLENETLPVTLGNPYAREIESFCRSIRTGEKLEVPASDAVYVQRVVEAAYEASAAGKTIALF